MRVLLLLVASAVAIPRHASPAHPAQFINNADVHMQITHMLGRPTSAEEVKSVADDMLQARQQLESTNATIQIALARLEEGAELLHNGICNFVGFCQGNPAHSCQEIADQPGVTASELPSGKYWMEAKKENIGTDIAPATSRVECLFDAEGKGWTLLFDDTHAAEVVQQPMSPVLKYFKFKEVLAFTPTMLEAGSEGVPQIVYYVDETNLETTKGKTLADMHNYMWSGQDGWGAANDKGTNFPNNQVHNRWKYFAKMDREQPYKNTLYIIDDGDIKDEQCKMAVDTTKCGQDFYCTGTEDQQIVGRIAQTNIPATSGGIISFGCSEGADEFTMCGACNYSPESASEEAQRTRSSIVQKMYVR